MSFRAFPCHAAHPMSFRAERGISPLRFSVRGRERAKRSERGMPGAGWGIAAKQPHSTSSTGRATTRVAPTSIPLTPLRSAKGGLDNLPPFSKGGIQGG